MAAGALARILVPSSATVLILSNPGLANSIRLRLMELASLADVPCHQQHLDEQLFDLQADHLHHEVRQVFLRRGHSSTAGRTKKPVRRSVTGKQRTNASPDNSMSYSM